MSVSSSHRAALVFTLLAALAFAAPARATSNFTLYVPTSASIHGNAGTFFHTDLWVFNRSFDTTLNIGASYRCFAGPCTGAAGGIILAPREAKLYSDVCVALFGMAETAGAIEIRYTSDSEDLVATTRTYTPGLPNPTNGTAIPALTILEARTRALFLGLGSNGGNLNDGFRSNAGAYNPGPTDTVVTYTLLRHDGTVIGSKLQPLAAGAAGQINDIFKAAGAGTMVTTNALLVVTSNTRVFPFVTVVDNQSGDSVYATASSDEPTPPVTSSVANGSFRTGMGSWLNPDPTYISMAWSPTDSTGDPASGSLVVTNSVLVPNGGGLGPSQCVALTPGSLVTLSARMRVPSGQSDTGIASPSIYMYGGSNCNGTYYDPYIWMRSPSRFDAWEEQSVTATVPAAVHSGRLYLMTGKSGHSGTFTAYFDDVSVVNSAR